MVTDPYTLRAIEYLSCIGFVALFASFWRYIDTPAAPRASRSRAGRCAGWFSVPEPLYFHPGHAWVRPDGGGVVTIGVDDFAQHLVGPLVGVALPAPGQTLAAGGQALAMRADGKAVDLLAPVSGTVVAVNAAAIDRPEVVNQDPYGRGWLLKIRVPDGAASLSHLRTAAAAREWIDSVSEQLVETMSPELGELVQDGGRPIDGLARAIDEEHWDEVARQFLAGRES